MIDKVMLATVIFGIALLVGAVVMFRMYVNLGLWPRTVRFGPPKISGRDRGLILG